MRRGKSVKLLELFVIAMLVLVARTLSSHAEGLGTIEGTITSANGAAISGAHVAVTGKGVNRMTTTDGSGHFSIGGLPHGTYKVIAAHAGYTAGTTTVKIASAITILRSLRILPRGGRAAANDAAHDGDDVRAMLPMIGRRDD